MKLSVIVPVYNEAATIAVVLQRVAVVPIRKEIIVVDDGSQDGTRERLQAIQAGRDEFKRLGSLVSSGQNELKVLLQPRNQGKGAAIRTALNHVTGDVVLIQDADLEYDPSEYPELLKPIIDGRADVVYGSRFTGTPRRVLYFRHAIGNGLLTFLSNLFTNLNLTDMETGYKVFRREVITSIPIWSNRFGIEPEITAKVARRGCRIYEVAISYSGRTYEEGKKISWKDGVAAIWSIVWFGLFDGSDKLNPGYRTLRRVRRLRRYNTWLWEKLRPFVGKRVLEAGAGIGNVTPFLLGCDLVIPAEIDPEYLLRLKNRFSQLPQVRVMPLDLSGPTSPALKNERVDTVLCTNVLEHIEDEARTLANFYDLLTEGGRVVLLVPAHPALHGSMDAHLGHYRRYTRDRLAQLMRDAGFAVEHLEHVNRIAVAGWYLNSKILRRKDVPAFQAYLFDRLVPMLRLEKYWRMPVGLSLIAVGRKPVSSASATTAVTELLAANM